MEHRLDRTLPRSRLIFFWNEMPTCLLGIQRRDTINLSCCDVELAVLELNQFRIISIQMQIRRCIRRTKIDTNLAGRILCTDFLHFMQIQQY